MGILPKANRYWDENEHEYCFVLFFFFPLSSLTFVISMWSFFGEALQNNFNIISAHHHLQSYIIISGEKKMGETKQWVVRVELMFFVCRSVYVMTTWKTCTWLVAIFIWKMVSFYRIFPTQKQTTWIAHKSMQIVAFKCKSEYVWPKMWGD